MSLCCVNSVVAVVVSSFSPDLGRALPLLPRPRPLPLPCVVLFAPPLFEVLLGTYCAPPPPPALPLPPHILFCFRLSSKTGQKKIWGTRIYPELHGSVIPCSKAGYSSASFVLPSHFMRTLDMLNERPGCFRLSFDDESSNNAFILLLGRRLWDFNARRCPNTKDAALVAVSFILRFDRGPEDWYSLNSQ